MQKRYRADFTCFDREFLVELKAIKTLTNVEWAQVVHYVKATQIPIALLVNFGREILQYDAFERSKIPASRIRLRILKLANLVINKTPVPQPLPKVPLPAGVAVQRL